MELSCEERDWLEGTVANLNQKMRYGIEKAHACDGIPYTTSEGEWVCRHINWWTNGFWPASMWQMYLMTGEEQYRAEAIRAEKLLDAALARFQDLDHDVGFQWLIHSGVRYALEQNQDSFDRTFFAANMLAARFNPHGFLRAWNGEGKEGLAIIDCMMNLPLLYWASDLTGDPRFRLMAMRHADTAMKHFIRKDGSSHHIVVFDPETGEPVDFPAGQGYAPGSSWSRGQAWAIYGFTLSWLCTGKKEYLETALRAARYFVEHLPPYGIPPCDFCQPREPDLKDCAAGAIAASGLLTLADHVSRAEGEGCRQAAWHLLTAMEGAYADWTRKTPAVLTGCTAAWHDEAQRHISMVYADYFFIEAMGKLRGEKRLFWRPQEIKPHAAE